MEPARVRLPDRAHAPVDAAVRLAEIERFGQRGSRASPSTRRARRSWRPPSRRARTAPRRGSVRTRAARSPRPAPDRGARAAALPVRGRSTRCTDATNAGALRMRSPRTVTRLGKWPNSAENMLPTSATPSSGSHTTSESIVSPPGTLTSSIGRPPHVDGVRVGERDVGVRGLRVRRDRRVVTARESRLTHDVGEEGQRAPDAQPVDALVVGLADGDVLLGDELGAVLAERVDPADVVGVALREDDVASRRGRHRVVVAPVRARLEPHAGVDHDPAVGVGRGDRGTTTTSRASTRCRRPCRARRAPTPGRPRRSRAGCGRSRSAPPDAAPEGRPGASSVCPVSTLANGFTIAHSCTRSPGPRALRVDGRYCAPGRAGSRSDRRDLTSDRPDIPSGLFHCGFCCARLGRPDSVGRFPKADRMREVSMVRNKLRAVSAVIPLVAAVAWVPTASAHAAVGQVPLSVSEATALSQDVTQKVIVLLKDQVPQAPASPASVGARSRVEAADQGGILGELGQTRSRNVHSYTTINAVAATVSAGEAARLAANPAVAEVVPDALIRRKPALDAPGKGSAAGGRTPVAGTCASPTAKPAARAGGDPRDPRRLHQPHRKDGALAPHRRRGCDGRLHRRRSRHQQHRLHPEPTAATCSSTTRTSAARAPPCRQAAARRSSTPARSRRRAATSTTSASTARYRSTGRAGSGSRESRRARSSSGSASSAPRTRASTPRSCRPSTTPSRSTM